MKNYQGRFLAKGTYKGPLLVSTGGLNTLATFQSSVLAGKKKVICSDQNNKDLYGKNLTGIALALPKTIGSTTGGMVLQVVCSMKINPAVLLFSESIDSLAAAGVTLAKVWEKSDIIVIDRLGDDFLKDAKSKENVEVSQEGLVTLS